MRTDGTRLDLRTLFQRGDYRNFDFVFGGRRHIGVASNQVAVSHLADAGEASIDTGYPEVELVLYCTPTGWDEDGRPIDRDGWLDVSLLTPWKEYWLELHPYGWISVERADSDGRKHRWHWGLPRDLWRLIQCR